MILFGAPSARIDERGTEGREQKGGTHASILA